MSSSRIIDSNIGEILDKLKKHKDDIEKIKLENQNDIDPQAKVGTSQKVVTITFKEKAIVDGKARQSR